MNTHIKLKYMGPWSDYSGYGEANRNYIAALDSAGVQLTTEKVVYVPEKVDFDWMGKLAQSLEDKPLDYKIKIIHITPDNYERFLEKGVYNIGHLFWETTSVPKSWIDNCNKLDELWTAAPYHAEVFKRSGIKIPIRHFPQCLDPTVYKNIKPFGIPAAKGYVFYSIFQWTERKNPQVLLKSYWKEFEGNDEVTLLLKVYRSSFKKTEYQFIKDEILRWKSEINQKHFPRVLLYGGLMSKSEIIRLHASCDCFVSTHRGEGWGIPQMEALAVGNPIISTNFGGIHCYLEDKKNAYLLPYKLVSVKGMTWIPWYTIDQEWASVSEDDARKAMRYVYSHRKQARGVGRAGQELVFDKFNYKKVGKDMLSRLREVSK